tara:strand:- start:12592 stop:13638 length:1047 start_codon:yes stop_codon:yes gene_type:complete
MESSSSIIIKETMNPYAEFLLGEEKKKKRKIDDAAFKIPKFADFDLLLKNDYRVAQLKEICKHYNQKKSGNKPELMKKLFNYLYLSHKVIPFQKNYRSHLIRRYCNYSGSAMLNRKKCINDTDILSLENLSTISVYQFFSYTDKDNNIYGFDLKCLINWLKKSKGVPTNPYNRTTIPSDVLNAITNKIKLSKVLKFPLMLTIQNTVSKEQESSYDFRILKIFQTIDELGNYTNPEWFLTLSRFQKTRFIRELYDIWFYRLDLTNEVRRNISPRGNPFRRFALNIQVDIIAVSEEVLNKFILSVMEEFVYYGVTDDYRNLGASYILTALTLVNNEVAVALPWLYQSVVS